MNNSTYLFFLPILLISCGGGVGSSSQMPLEISINLSSNLNEIYIHNEITLTWSSSNADSCLASGDWDGAKTKNGAEDIVIRESKESNFILTCSSSSSSVNKTIIVTSNSPYIYADYWDEINTYIESLKSSYENPIGFNQEEVWFKTLTVPKSEFTTEIVNIYLDDENFSGSVGYDTWINVGNSSYHLNCNWVPQKPNEGGIKIIELINGVFTNLYYKKIEGCNHPIPIKNSNNSYQIVFPGHDEGKLPDAEPTAPSFVFNLDMKEFTNMNISLGSHGQAIFDYDLDGDDDIITNGAGFTNDPNLSGYQNCGEWGIMRNNGFNDFELISLPFPDDIPNPNPSDGPVPQEGCGSAMGGDAYVENELLYVVYTDFFTNVNKVNKTWDIEKERNAMVIYNLEDLTIQDVIELPASYIEVNFDNLEYYEDSWIGTNGKSHDTHAQFMDIDYDGDKDILLSNQSYWYEKTSVLQILINNNGSYKDETAERLFNWNIRTGGLHQWSFSDVNGDGYLDITTTDGCQGFIGIDNSIPRNFGCEKKVAINDGTGHFLQIIGPIEIYQIFENNEFKTGQLKGIFGLDNNEIPRWTYMTAKDCSDGCYADGDWDVFITSLGSKLSTGPNGIDPGLVGEDGFNEFFYILHNPSARKSIQSGEYENGLEHYIAIGKDSGLLPNAKSLTNINVDNYDANPKDSIN